MVASIGQGAIQGVELSNPRISDLAKMLLKRQLLSAKAPVVPQPIVTPATDTIAEKFITPMQDTRPRPFVTPAIDASPRQIVTPNLGPIEPEMMHMYVGSEDNEIGAFQPIWDKGKTRREISDEGAAITPLATSEFNKGTRITPDKYINVKVGEVLDHPDLHEKYPEFKDYLFGGGLVDEMDKLTGKYGERGSYGNKTVVARGTDVDDLKSTLLHELQHAIQEKEGFARGGSPSEFKSKSIPKKFKDIAFKRDMREMAISQKLEKFGLPVSEGKYHSLNNRTVMNEAEKLADVDPDVSKYLSEYKELSNILDKYPSSHEQYQRLAGEIEARDTQARIGMSEMERQRSQPYASQGISLGDVIVRRGGGKVEAYEPPTQKSEGGDIFMPNKKTRDAISLRPDKNPEPSPNKLIVVEHSTTPEWIKKFMDQGIDATVEPPDSRLGRLTTDKSGKLSQSKIKEKGLFISPAGSQTAKEVAVIITKAGDVQITPEAQGLGYKTGLQGLYGAEDGIINSKIDASQVAGWKHYDYEKGRWEFIPNQKSKYGKRFEVSETGNLTLK